MSIVVLTRSDGSAVLRRTGSLAYLDGKWLRGFKIVEIPSRYLDVRVSTYACKPLRELAQSLASSGSETIVQEQGDIVAPSEAICSSKEYSCRRNATADCCSIWSGPVLGVAPAHGHQRRHLVGRLGF